MEDIRQPYKGAKIPTEENGIRVERTVCDMCSTGCNIDAYMKNGTVIKVTGCKNPAYGNGYLCARGHANRRFIYHEDRIRTPLRRTGERGEGKFEPISWDEALDEIEKRFLDCREKYGASSVAFTGGYHSWEMAALQRLTYGFGSVNCTGSAFARWDASDLAAHIAAGCPCRPDVEHCGVVLMWGCNVYNRGNVEIPSVLTEKRGAKVIAIDPRVTISTYRLADLHLRPKPGSDAALAHGLARIFIEKGWVNKTYIAQHIQGFFDYRAYINDFTPERVEKLTGISVSQLQAAAHLIMHNGPMTVRISDIAFASMKNGVQTRRAIEALCAITGNFDVRGGLLPVPEPSLQQRVLRDFAAAAENDSLHAPVGAQRYPLVSRFSTRCQLFDLPRQIREGTPYPVRGLCSFGLNIRAFPNDGAAAAALQELDFFVDVDLFMNHTVRYADIVLPACSSFERESVNLTKDHRIYYTPPVIEPIGEARDDLSIICDLARRLVPGDRLLCSGASYLYDYWLSNMGLSMEVLKAASEPLPLHEEPYHPGSYTESGYRTASGRYELKSELMAAAGEDPLPAFEEERETAWTTQYPMVLSVGTRQMIGSPTRTRHIDWLRALRPFSGIDLHPEDGAALGIGEGEEAELQTPSGALRVAVHLTQSVHPGMVLVVPSSEDLDICSILPEDCVDPVSGMPAFRSMRCRLQKL